MRWSKPNQRVALKLQAIEIARRAAAQDALALAASDKAEASKRRDASKAALAEADRAWQDRISSPRLDLEIGLVLGAQLVARSQGLDQDAHELTECERREDIERLAVQRLDGTVRGGERVIGKGRRLLARKAESRRDLALSDRTSWAWFTR